MAIKLAPRNISNVFQSHAAQIQHKRTAGYCPHEPHLKQREFISCLVHEVFYGGAAGGGKSDAILMAALQYVHVPGYAALILRRSYADLVLPGAIMNRALDWLAGSDAKWNNKEKTFTFPSGATLTFGYLQTETDKYRYQGAEFQFIGFDELTQFTSSQYLYLFSRLRRLKTSDIPLRMRGASNPGGVGHEWVKERFIDHPGARVFIPATLEDNPSLDAEEYEKALDELDPVTRAQLLQGDWRILPPGLVFEESWFSVIDDIPPLAHWVRYWDLATGVKKRNDDTAGSLIGYRPNGTLVVADCACWQREWPETRDGIRDDLMEVTPGGEGIIGIVGLDYRKMEGLQLQHNLKNKPVLHVGVESNGMQLALVQDLSRNDEFIRVPFYSQVAHGDKLERAQTWAARARMHGIELVRGPWNRKFIDECVAFDGNGVLKDNRVDSVSGGVELIYRTKGKELEAPKLVIAGTWDYYEQLAKQQKRIGRRR